MMILGIQSIASYIPKGRSSNLNSERLLAFGTDEKFVLGKVGVRERAFKDSSEETSSLAGKALEALFKKTGISRESIEALVVVTQNPDSNLPHVSAIVHGEAGLAETCAAFDISLGCSGYVYGLSILSAFLQANGMSRGVLITADPYSKIVDPEDKNTALLFGDAATATLLSGEAVLTLGPFSFGTIGKSHEALVCRDGKLSMNGREVFNFAATRIPQDILALLNRCRLETEDIDAFLFHQGSRYILETIAARLKIPLDRVRLGLEEIGNTISSSIPLLLEKEMVVPTTQRMILSGFGVGLSYSSCLCQRHQSH
jgi:3-oxoacyl-[acyl-carrier-protein] synthase III